MEPFSAHKNENGDIFARGSQVCSLNNISGVRDVKG